MASDTNTVVLIGRLTRAPELRSLASGTSLANLRLAVNSTVKNKNTDEWEDAPNFFNVSVWGRQAESVAKYCGQGDRVSVSGRLEWREWEAENGGKREQVSVVANQVQFLTTKGERSEPTAARSASEPAPF